MSRDPREQYPTVRELKSITAKATLLDPSDRKVYKEELIPLIKILRDEKNLSWINICEFMHTHANMPRTPNFWANLYKQHA